MYVNAQILIELAGRWPFCMWDFPIFLSQEGPKMKRKRYSEEKIISILKEQKAGASSAEFISVRTGQNGQ
jgi:hypothetical protein